ncbi:MAG: helix-turn-helix transcriptional regulator [Flavobacteriaceae bacterium]|nr:helix-turn-helix transcriptional regulator [Flavobacteriaceae bacterium]
MNAKKTIILPQYRPYFEELGDNIRLARKRRQLTVNQIAQRASIHRATLYRIEKGDPSVSIGSYFKVFKAMNLHEDFKWLGANDVEGQRLQDLSLL